MITWLLISGAVDAGPVEDWLRRLPLGIEGRSHHEAAVALAAGRPVAGRISPPDGKDVPVRFRVDEHGLTVEMDGPAGDDPWWTRLVTEAGRSLSADTVALVDDISALLPRLLWVSPTATGDFTDARRQAVRVESLDGALLLHR
ncbi:hypothetical protein [Paractinoplanes rishiriensis]|uniref:Uncharacterized protein n=1 Tax=Paractinoplanes rishiriensis TaxID=1050105 RepID=A0A919K270_9ACTN|nr:hypothetical protein [Actinoplanes rishiriensis]GIE98908.1 hypothetical protein Ari01nite_63730 [Actinoplanes rishiriensis]